MSRRLSLTLLCLLLWPGAQAMDVRLAFPSAYADDVFITSLLSNKGLRDAGLNSRQKSSAARPRR